MEKKRDTGPKKNDNRNALILQEKRMWVEELIQNQGKNAMQQGQNAMQQGGGEEEAAENQACLHMVAE